ncbi:MAG: FAD-binding oxidoreductase [Terriglobia bacterium]
MSQARISLHGLSVIVGEGNHVDDAGARAAFAVDGIVPQCAVFPRSEDEVARVLKRAAESGLAVIPCRNATKLGIGGVPQRYDVALGLKNLGEIRHFEPADLTVSAEPGIELAAFQRFLKPHRLWLPFDPPGAGRASLGGIVAANSSGPLRLKYGAPRDCVLGMKIATTDGKIVKTGGRVVKNVAGYDLSRLLTGSYGTLGVIVEISFKLFPLPAARSSWRVLVANLDSAHEFRRKILQSPLGPSRMALLDGAAAAFAHGNAPDEFERDFEIWMEFSGSERVLERCAQTLGELSQAAGVAAGALEDGAAEAGWERIADFSSILPAGSGHLIVFRATLPIASSEGFVGLIACEAKKIGARCACFCQNGVGIVRACLMPGELDSGLVAAVAKLRAEAVERGGALVIEQCPAEMKKHVDVWGPAGNDFGLMRKLKELWDPKGTLSPGRFVGGL